MPVMVAPAAASARVGPGAMEMGLTRTEEAFMLWNGQAHISLYGHFHMGAYRAISPAEVQIRADGAHQLWSSPDATSTRTSKITTSSSISPFVEDGLGKFGVRKGAVAPLRLLVRITLQITLGRSLTRTGQSTL